MADWALYVIAGFVALNALALVSAWHDEEPQAGSLEGEKR